LCSWTDHFKKDLGSSFAHLYLQQARAAFIVNDFGMASTESAKGELLWKRPLSTVMFAFELL